MCGPTLETHLRRSINVKFVGRVGKNDRSNIPAFHDQIVALCVLVQFLRDKLKLAYIDAGNNWLIFNAPEVEVGCHPSDKTFQDMSFYCDNIEETVAELKANGVEFIGEIEDHGYGLVIHFMAPGDFKIQLYQAKYK